MADNAKMTDIFYDEKTIMGLKTELKRKHTSFLIMSILGLTISIPTFLIWASMGGMIIEGHELLLENIRRFLMPALYALNYAISAGYASAAGFVHGEMLPEFNKVPYGDLPWFCKGIDRRINDDKHKESNEDNEDMPIVEDATAGDASDALRGGSIIGFRRKTWRFS